MPSHAAVDRGYRGHGLVYHRVFVSDQRRGMRLTVPKIRAMASAGRKLAQRPHMIVLGMIESFFEGGARWARRTYCTADGKRCLLGAIEHVCGETGFVDNRATEYLAGAINRRQLSKGLPPLGDTAIVTVIGFNDAFRRSYAEGVEILSEARNLALSDTGVVEGAGQSE